MTTATERLLRSHRPADGPLRILAASGQLGYGIPEPALERGLARQPHFIGCDMGSIDPGPHYLGSGTMAAPAAMVRRDLELVLLAARRLDVPLVIGSAGTAGAAPQLDATVALIRAIAQQHGLQFRLTTVHSDLQPAQVLDALADGRLDPIGPMPMPGVDDVLRCTHIVGQCGTETLARALQTPTDVLVAGRACDTAIFATLPEMLGYPSGLSLHMAKIVECTSLCCRPSGRDAMLAELGPDSFTLESMNPQAHATPASVAAHALYEQADPLEVDEPTGTLLLHDASYEALDAHRTRVHGAGFRRRTRPTLKIEGAAPVGERCVLLAGVADPTLLTQLPQALAAVEEGPAHRDPACAELLAQGHLGRQPVGELALAQLLTQNQVDLVVLRQWQRRVHGVSMQRRVTDGVGADLEDGAQVRVAHHVVEHEAVGRAGIDLAGRKREGPGCRPC